MTVNDILLDIVTENSDSLTYVAHIYDVCPHPLANRIECIWPNLRFLTRSTTYRYGEICQTTLRAAESGWPLTVLTCMRHITTHQTPRAHPAPAKTLIKLFFLFLNWCVTKIIRKHMVTWNYAKIKEEGASSDRESNNAKLYKLRFAIYACLR